MWSLMRRRPGALVLMSLLTLGLLCGSARVSAQPDPPDNAAGAPGAQPNRNNAGQRGNRGNGGPGGFGGFGMMMPVQMTATDQFLFIVRGDMLYQYSTVDLKLINKTALEPIDWAAMRQRMGNPGGGPGGAPAGGAPAGQPPAQ